MEVIIINKAEDKWIAKDYQSKIEEVINLVVDYLSYQQKFSNAVLSIVLANDEFICELNKDYRGKNKRTNILSFAEVIDINYWDELTESNGLGDLVLSFDTINNESRDQGKSFSDHFCHLIIHGFLHLLGYNHIGESEASIMEGIEIKILNKLDINNPYEDI